MLRVNRNGTKAWYVQLNRNRKRKIGDAHTMTAAVARYRAQDILKRQSTSGSSANIASKGATLEDFLRTRYARASHHPTHRLGVERLCAALGELAKTDMNQIGFSQIERWKLKRSNQVRPATVNRELVILRAAMTKAHIWGLLGSNPIRRVKNLKLPAAKAIRVLSQYERTRLLHALKARHDHIRPIVYLALYAGLRRGETFGLKWRNVMLGPTPSLFIERPQAGLTARQTSRRLPLGSVASQELKLWRDRSERWGPLVFRNSSGGRLRSITTGWTALMQSAQIYNFSFRDCRHDFAVRLVKAGAPLSHIRDLMGHASIRLTERYATFVPGSIRQSIALVDID